MKHSTRILALVLSLAMVAGVLAVLPLTTSAFSAGDNELNQGTVQGTPLPEGATAYDGTPSAKLEGDGTSDSPYLIASAADFVYFRDTASGADTAAGATATTYFKLTDDIYLNNESYGTSDSASGDAYPGYNIGKTTAPNFAGHLDGDEHTIYNLYGYSTSIALALFNTLTGSFKNTVFDGVRLDATQKDVGTLAMTISAATVDNVHIKNANLYGKLFVGGFAKLLLDKTTISNCVMEGSIHAAGQFAGGIAATHDDASKSGEITIENCTNHATITGGNGNSCFGGMLGADRNSNSAGYVITGCTNTGDITSTSTAGGIVGDTFSANTSTITNCTNTGTITTNKANAGGIFGSSSRTTGTNFALVMTDCINRGAINGTGASGGLVGAISARLTLDMTNCANYADVTSSTGYSGGLVGSYEIFNPNYGDVKFGITNCASYGDVSGVTAAGVVGKLGNGKASSSYTMSGLLLKSNVTGRTKASAIVGELAYTPSTAVNLKLDSVWMQGSVSATSGVTAVFCAGTVGYNSTKKTDNGNYYVYTPCSFDPPLVSATAVDCGFDVVFSENGTVLDASDVQSARANHISDDYDGSTVYASNDSTNNLAAFLALYTKETLRFGYNNGTEEVTTASYPAASGETFAANALEKLNASALENEATEWMADDNYIAVFKMIALVLANEDALSHQYTGEAVEASYVVNDANVKAVSVSYFDIASGEPAPLTTAPILPGTYRVVLQGLNGSGAALGSPVSCDYTITKGTVAFAANDETVATLVHSNGFPGDKNVAWYNAQFTGDVYTFFAKVYHNTNNIVGDTLNENLSPTRVTRDGQAVSSMREPGTYMVYFSYEGSELYEPATAQFKFDIQQKIDFAGATISLGNQAKLNFYLNRSDFAFYTNPIVKLVDDKKVATEARLVGDYYVVTYDISASELATAFDLYISVTDDHGSYEPRYLMYIDTSRRDEVFKNSITYSPMDYIINMYKKTDHAKYEAYKPVLETLALYGAEAEAKANGIAATETAVMAAVLTAGIEDFVIPTWTEGYDAYINPNAPIENAVGVIGKHAAAVGARLTGGISLELSGMTPGNKVHVTTDGLTEKEYTVNEGGVLTITDLHAAMIMSEVTLDFGGGDIAIFTVGNYLNYRMAQDAEGTETALIQATILYMMAAREYVLAN